MTKREVVAFEAAHWAELAREALAEYRIRIDPEAGLACYRGGPAWTALFDGQVAACGGLIEPWPGYGIAWLLLSERIRRDRAAIAFVYRALTRELQGAIRSRGLRRIEANVDAGLGPAQRLAAHLGFVRESIMPRYGPNGETFFKYVLLGGDR